MAAIEMIKNEILGYKIENDIIEVEFENYILEVNLKDMDQLEISKDNLAKIIFEKYQ